MTTQSPPDWQWTRRGLYLVHGLYFGKPACHYAARAYDDPSILEVQELDSDGRPHAATCHACLEVFARISRALRERTTLTEPKPTEREVFMTTLPDPSFDGWYCSNHPSGESLANAEVRSHCWGCGKKRPPEETPS